MSIENNLREHARTSVALPIRYSAVVFNLRELRKISDTAVSVDIGNGGVGILTGYLLEKGHVVIFENEIEVDNSKAKVATVRWVNKAGDGKYRVGLKFVTH